MGVPKTVVWNGKEYRSIEEAARDLGLSPTGLRERLRNGYTKDSDVGNWRRRPVVWNGVYYRSIAEAARANNVHKVTMRYRIEQGYTCDEDMKW